MLPVRGGERFLRAVFEPLGYDGRGGAATRSTSGSPSGARAATSRVTARQGHAALGLLTHLYVLIPVFDNAKHYFVGDDEMEKLLAKGEGWLAGHPEKEEIARRYLRVPAAASSARPSPGS